MVVPMFDSTRGSRRWDQRPVALGSCLRRPWLHNRGGRVTMSPALRADPAPLRGCGRHLIGDTGRVPAPGRMRGVHRSPAGAAAAGRGQRVGMAGPATGRRSTRRSSARSWRTFAGCRPGRRRRRRHPGARARPPGDRPHRLRARRRAGPVSPRPRPRVSRRQWPRSTSRRPRPATPAGAGAHGSRGRGLPAGPTAPVGRRPDSRRGLAESLFERVEVLGLRRMHLEPTPAAVAAGPRGGVFARICWLWSGREG